MPGLEFIAADPFPFLPADSYTLEQAQIHAASVDDWIGLSPQPIEDLLVREQRYRNQDVQAWTGLAVRSMLTPYVEIRSMLHDLAPEPGTTIVDLGAGYGRMAWVIDMHYSDVSFIGYELVEERVQEAKRCLELKWPKRISHRVSQRISMICADLESPQFAPANADFYFMYDFGTRAAIEKSLQDLRRIAATQAVTIVGRGRSSRDAIERNHPWLSQITPPRHTRNYSIYKSR